MASLGETRVRTDFNPSANDKVTEIKQAAARLINLVEELRGPTRSRPAEVQRLVSLAQTDIESAAMWAVKAATAPKELRDEASADDVEGAKRVVSGLAR